MGGMHDCDCQERMRDDCLDTNNGRVYFVYNNR